MLAITHIPSPRMEQCQLTYVTPMPIDHDLACRQHMQYCRMLERCGADVITLDVNRDYPDCAFVEDTAIVLDEVAVLTTMGTAARRGEPAGIEPELRKYRDVHRIALPATIEGGDVLPVGRTLLVGLSSRTNRAGMDALADIVSPLGYVVRAVPVHGCLHLKTACTALDEKRLLVNPAWVGVQDLHGFELVSIPPDEPWAANQLRLGASLCLSVAHVQTAEKLGTMGFDVHTVDVSEFVKAEAGVTCLSLVFSE